jgi:hypothetical protein
VTAEPRLSERRVGVEIDAVKFVYAGRDSEQDRACAVADLERLGVAAIGDHPQSEVDPFAKEPPDERTPEYAIGSVGPLGTRPSNRLVVSCKSV